MTDSNSDTICAIATPSGTGGIGVIRVSGPDADQVITRLIKKLPPARTPVLAKVRDTDDQVIDHALVLRFEAPASFTGEDTVELHCHGGQVVLQLVMQALISAGARAARPGEFTQRAFLNDKLDLTRAEAIADLIHAGSEAAVRAANRSMEGGLSVLVKQLQNDLELLRIWIEAALDFPEEEIDFLADIRLMEQLQSLQKTTESLIQKAKSGVQLTKGARIAILGPPNAGKSSLLNALVQYDAAIVTDIPGTTRDLLKERIEIDGIPLEIIDTAGLRESLDPIEKEGIRRARAVVENADLALWLLDLTNNEPAPSEDYGIPLIRVGNKIDLITTDKNLHYACDVLISAKTGEGLDRLKQVILEKLQIDSIEHNAFTARPRHVAALNRVHQQLHNAEKHMQTADGELVAEELLATQHALSEITGEYHNNDLLGAIFSNFCIGK